MYIYFDKNGTIKEVINDESIRKGSSDYNKIYCYLEGNPDIDDIWYLQKNPDGTLTNEVSFVDNIVTKAIPYDSKRDMKYFQDFEEYKFYVFTLSSSYLSQNGLVVATIRVAENNTLWALGELTFNVQANIVNSDNDITQSQYDYLLLTISSYYSKTEIDNKLSLKADKTYVDNALSEKADKSTTYTKTESDMKFFRLGNDNIIDGYNEFYGETKFFNDVYVDNFDIIQTRGGFSTEGNVEAVSFSKNGTGLDSIYASKDDTYTKSEVDSKLDLKADKSDTYTKQEVNELGAGLYDQIEMAHTSISNLSTETYHLRLDLDNLSSVQNVVDVVATYADLQSHDKDYLETNDKIQVIADETNGGASTIYSLEFDRTWKFIGAFGDNTYNKTELDNLLNDKADKSDTYTREAINNFISVLDTNKADKSDVYTKQEEDTKFEEVGQLFETVGNELENKANAEYICKGTAIEQVSYSNTNPSKSAKVVIKRVGGMSYKVNGTIQHSAVYAIWSMNGSNIYNNLSIPSEIQNLAGYGWGINNYTYNYIDFVTKKFVQMVGSRAYQSGDESDTSVITDGTTTYYKLVGSNQVITDISSYITKDTLDVVDGGTLEFKNTYNQAVKNVVEYIFNAVTINNIVDSNGNAVDIAMKTDIPTVNDPLITFIQGGAIKGTIHLNQADNQSIAFEAGGSGGGSSVVANPNLSGDEATLNGLEVDGTKYKVGGGSGTIILDNIVDKKGNKRFIEGEGVLLEQEGFNVSYNKWSLSGTHLMLVLVFSTTKVISQNSFLVTYTLPDYIMNKIIPFEFNEWVEIKRITSMDVNKSSILFDVSKFDGVLRIRNLSNIGIGSNFRVQFDLLIDSE